MNTTRSLLAFALLAGSTSLAGANTVFNETVVHDTTTPVTIELDDSTVLCSSADYGALFLKILIPELSRLTLLDHQNTGAGAPCVAAGACYPGHMPEDIIDATKPTEQVSINVKAVRLDEVDITAETCSTYLVEKVKVTIRGFDFVHERNAPLGSRPFSDCVSTPAPVTDEDPADTDSPADDPGQIEAEPSGGCNARGGSGSLGLVLALGALVGGRRRRSR